MSAVSTVLQQRAKRLYINLSREGKRWQVTPDRAERTITGFMKPLIKKRWNRIATDPIEIEQLIKAGEAELDAMVRLRTNHHSNHNLLSHDYQPAYMKLMDKGNPLLTSKFQEKTEAKSAYTWDYKLAASLFGATYPSIPSVLDTVNTNDNPDPASPQAK